MQKYKLTLTNQIFMLFIYLKIIVEFVLQKNLVGEYAYSGGNIFFDTYIALL